MGETVRRFNRLLCILVVLAVCSLQGSRVDALDPDVEESLKIPTRLKSSEEIVYDMVSTEVTARGDVLVEREGFTLSADVFHGFLTDQTAEAEGNILAISGEDVFRGDRMEFDFGQETGTFFNGVMFFKEDNYHVKADKIEKTGENTYLARDVFITTCDGDSPSWEMEGKKLDITVGGYGTVSPALFRVGGVPLLYFPYMIFPVKLDRQSGLLAPEFDLYSNRKGVSISQPFYWAVNESSDMTFYTDFMTRRGLKLGAEYRYFLSETDNGMVKFDFLEDDKVDDGSGTSSQDWGYDDDDYLRPNEDRYWFRMKHDSKIGDRTALTVDLDIVSDQDYLHEFRSGYSGFSESRAEFLDLFNRDLDDYTDPVRKNRLNFNTQWYGYSLNAEALWWDDVIARRSGETDGTVQSLPAVSLNSHRKPFFGSLLYSSLDVQSAYLYRKDGVRGARFDVYPRLYMPFRLGNVLSVEPSLGGRETFWKIDSGEGNDTGESSTRHRELYDAKFDVSSEVYNVFDPGWDDIDALKHSLRLQAAYEYIPSKNQESYPYFDGLDRIEGENLITYSMANSFTTRTGTPGDYEYRQVVRLELAQSWDIGLERDGDSAPFSPIIGDVQLNFGNWCQLLADAEWSVEDNDFVSHNLAYRFSDRRGDRLVLQHRYSESLSESIIAAMTLKVTDRIWLFSEYERNLKKDRMVFASLGGAYRAQCWSLEGRFEREEDDTSFQLVVSFRGLGDVGGDSEYSDGFAAWATEGL